MEMPKEAEYIIKTLEDNGFEAYIVGGCVRDFILKRKPEDWDITTSAAPMEVKRLFERTYDTGIEHGTVSVVINSKSFEVTTFRIDGNYIDFRHPETVTFTKSIEEDLSRRDFTINAIAYNNERGFQDPFDGRGDIDRHIIRGVGNADKRFKEDALRMLRALRFSAQIGFDIESETMKAIFDNAPLIKNISMERIRDEFLKLLNSDRPQKTEDIVLTGLSDYFFPELKDILKENKNVIGVTEKCPKSYALRLAALLCGVEYKKCESILKRFKLDNKTIKYVLTIRKYIDCPLKQGVYPTRVILSQIGEEAFKDLINIKFNFALIENDLFKCKTLDNIYDEIDDIIKAEDCISLKSLAVNGEDIKKLGITDGKKIGEALRFAFEEVLKKPNVNKKEILLEFLKNKTNEDFVFKEEP